MRYAISGQARREKKKELAQLKSLVRNIWHWEDVDQVYGGGLGEDVVNKIIEDTERRITEIELELSKPHISIERENKLNGILWH